jgi:MFS family permease
MPHRTTAGILIACAVMCAALATGLRQSFGLFLAPMTEAHAWTASGFAFAIALSVLLNGMFQPICGQIADRIGGKWVVMGGTLLYAVAILGMAMSESIGAFTFFGGVLLGIAVSAAGMPVIIASLTRLLPEESRGRAVGLGTAGSSFGQFLVVPLAGFGMAGLGWEWTLWAMAGVALLMIPLAIPLADQPAPEAPGAAEETAQQALGRAFRTPTFWFLFFGFFVCGLHVSFLTVHLPGFVHSCGLPVAVGAGAIGLIGLFNIAGSLAAGELSQRWKRRELLVGIYAARGVLMAGFMALPKTTETVLLFSALMGILWLSTVPPTVALCARNFGTRWLATIFGLVFLGHQIGGFTGAWLGGLILDRSGSYDLMWTIGILASAFAAMIHMPVKDPALAPKPATA